MEPRPGHARASLTGGLLVAAAFGLAGAFLGCGAGAGHGGPRAAPATPTTPSPPRTPSPAATPAPPPPPLVAVLDRPLGTTGNRVHLHAVGGDELASTSLGPDVEAVGLAGRRVLVVGDGRIDALDEHGTVATVESIAPADPTVLVDGLVADSSGEHWLWSAARNRGDGTLETQVFEGTAGAAPMLLADHVGAQDVLVPVRWTAAGPVLSDEPTGIGGYSLFRRGFGATSLLRPASGTLSPLQPASCAVSDVAADGTTACVTGGREVANTGAPMTLRIIAPQGPMTAVAIPAWARQAGSALFSPDATTLSVAYSAAVGPPGEHITTALVAVASGALRPLPIDGLVPAGWTSGGELVAIRTPDNAGGAAGTYVVAADGGVTQVCPQWNIVGVSG